MRVCHFISYSIDSHYTKNLGLGLAKNGIQVTFITLFESGREAPDWVKESENISYFCLRANSKKDFFFAALKLARILRRERIDILQMHLYEASFVGTFASKLAGTKLRILTRHYLDQNHQIGNKFAVKLDLWEAKEADKIVVLSNAVKEFLISQEGIDPNKIQLIYQGFDFENFSAGSEDRVRVRSEFGFSEKDFVIGTFANFFPTKGHRFLVEAVENLKCEIPNIKLFFVGDGGGGKENLQTQIDEAGLSERVIFAGFRKDVPACMGAIDMMVHPSLSEAFCQVIIEAMSVGRFVVSTDVGGAKEVIENGVTGFLIPSEDTTAIKDAIRKVYYSGSLREEIASAGQKSVRERFTVDRMVNRQKECYENWLAEKTTVSGSPVP